VLRDSPMLASEGDRVTTSDTEECPDKQG
jgi:hypothetical protein